MIPGRRHIRQARYAVEHHAKSLDLIWAAFKDEMLGVGARWESVLGGPNSNYFTLFDGRRIYVSGRPNPPKPHLEIRNRYLGPVVIKLYSERDVMRYAESLAESQAA